MTPKLTCSQTLGLTLCCLLACSMTHAQQPLNRADVESFFDEAWAESMHQDGLVPGAVVTVVEDGNIILNKGYGVRDTHSGAAVDPGTTRVRIGSTSKLFTVLTALSLVDQGSSSWTPM